MNNKNEIELEHYLLYGSKEHDQFTLSCYDEKMAHGSFQHADATIVHYTNGLGNPDVKLEIGPLFIDLDFLKAEQIVAIFGFTVKDFTDC